MTNRDLLELIANQVSKLTTQVETLTNDVAEVKTTMATKDELAEVKTTMATKDELAEVKTTMATKDELAEVKADIKSIKETVIKIEGDHGQKLGALLDGYKHNSEILMDHTLRLERIEEKVTAQDIQIQVLKKT